MRYLFTSIIFFTITLNAFSQADPKAGLAPEFISAQVRGEIYKIRNAGLSPDSMRYSIYHAISAAIKRSPKNEMNFTLIAEALELTALQVDTLVSLTDSSIANSPYRSGEILTRRRLAVAETGKAFPELILKDTLGNAMPVSSLKGKMVLIDFWGSGCRPCRQQMPDLKKIYTQYHDKGFEIIGISMDKDKAPWLAAIRQDRQPWLQYAELISWDKNKAAALFSIYAIPSNILVDKNGIIIGQDLSIDQIATLVSVQ